MDIILPSNEYFGKELGEAFVYQILNDKGLNPQRPQQHSGIISFVTQYDMWIVKTLERNWTNEDIDSLLGLPFVLSEMSTIVGKQLKIVCVGKLEYELTNGSTRIFAKDDTYITTNRVRILELWADMGIQFVKFSDLSKK